MCLGLGLMERLTGQRAARKQQQKSARLAQEQARLGAEGAQDQLETNIAQQAAARKAEELLKVPIEGTDVSLATEDTNADPITGRRRSARSRFQAPSTSGLLIP